MTIDDELSWKAKTQITGCHSTGVYALKNTEVSICVYKYGEDCQFHDIVKTGYGNECYCTKHPPEENEVW